MYEQDMKIIESAQNGNKEDMTKLIEDNNRLIWSIVRRFNGRGYDPEDLFQIGCIGLIKFRPRVAPTSFPRPGAVRRYAHISIHISWEK